MSALFKSELLEELQAKVTDDAYILYEALATCNTVSYEIKPHAIEQVADYVHSVGECAGKANLLGLQRVCDLTQEYMSTLNDVPQESLCSEVERWPRLVSNYLYAPDNVIHCQQLIAALQHADWQIPLSDEQAQELLNLLQQNEAVSTAPTISKAETDMLDSETLFDVLAKDEQLPEIIDDELPIDEIEEIDETEFEDELFEVSEVDESNELDILDDTAAFNVLATDGTLPPVSDEEFGDDDEVMIEDELADKELSLNEENLFVDDDSEFFSADLDEDAFDSIDEIPALENVAIRPIVISDEDNDDEVSLPFADVSKQEFDKILDETVFDDANHEEEQVGNLSSEVDVPGIELGDEFFDDEHDEKENELPDDLDDISLEESVLALETAANNYPSELTENTVVAITEVSTDKTEERYSEDLENLSNKVVELSDVLSTALNKFITEENDTEPFLEGIEEYTNAVQSLWEMSEKCGLTGLQQVCTFINDNIFELSTQPQLERFALHDLFALYPQFILEYLQHTITGSEKLVELLQNPQWAIPLIDMQAEELLVVLRQEAEIALQEASYVDNQSPPQLLESKLYPPKSFSEIEKDVDKPIETSINVPIVDESDEFIDNSEEEHDFTTQMMVAFDEAFGYQETDEIVSESDVIESEEIAFEAQPEESLDDEISFDEVFSEDLADDENFEDRAENALIDSGAIIDSDSEIAIAAETLNGETIPATIQLADPEILDMLDAEISDAINDLSKALSRFTTATDNSPDLLEAVEQYTDNVSAIANEAEIAGLIGLKEVCEFVNENLLELSAHAHAIRRNAYTHIEKWPHLVLYYLHAPLLGARELVAHLSAPAWFLPLSQERADVLLHRLTQGVLGSEQTAESIEEDFTTNIINAPSEFDEKYTVAMIEDELNDEHTLESAETYESEEIASPKIELASPEVLELLIGQLTETKGELARIFAELIAISDDSEALLIAIESYTENVQTLWDTAEMANLVGLQEVCSFVNDNVMVLGGENQQVRGSVRDVFETWIDFVLAYLHEPDFGADQLVTHLQAAHWLHPLSCEQAAALKQQLLATKSEAVEESLEESLPEENLLPTIPSVEPEIILVAPESLDLLIGQITDISEELTDTLQTLVEAEEGSEALLTAVETYTDNVQAIWDAADMVGLIGVQDICTFINDNITILSASDKKTRINAHQVFKTWHLSVLTYLQTPKVGAVALINQLQDRRWVAPLDTQQANVLKQRLLTTATDALKNDTIPTNTVADSAHSVEQTIVLADPDVLALIIGQITDIAGELSATLIELVQAEDGSETLLTAVETYTENVQAIWDAAEMANLVGLQDVCTFINDNVMLLSAGDQPTRQTAHEVFDGWTQFVLAYLNNPATGAIKLVKHLQQAQWFAPLSDELATTLQQRLLNSPASVKTEEPPVYLADPDVLEVVRNQITDVIDGLSEALKVCVSMENDNPALLEAIENYTNSVQAIWDTAEMAGLVGLQEVCTFVNDNFMALATLDSADKQAAQACFVQWPSAVLAYLQSPLTESTSLVELLQHPHWPMPLEDERIGHLLPLLTRPSQEPSQVAAFEAQMAAVSNDVDDETEPAEPLAELEMEEGEQVVSLGSAEVLEILTSELESSKEELIIELEKFTTLANQDPAFSEAAEVYGDIVMRLYAAAEMLGLEGLQAVTTFIVDNIKSLATQDLSIRAKAKKVLEAWPDLVLTYLNAPMAGVIPMLNHFRESGWATPLADNRAHELLSLLTQSAAVDEGIEESSAYARQSVASPEDVILTLPDDINPDLFEAYLQETPQHASDFSQLIQSIIAEPQIQDIERAQRIAHTLKGSSNIIGIKGIANMGHHLEDILEYLAKHQVKPPKELTDVMVEAADCIEMMVDSLMGQGDAPDNAQQILQSILDWANRIDKGNLDAPATPSPTAATSSKKASSSSETTEETKPKKEGGAVVAGAPEQVLRVPTKTVDDLMRLVGELSISLGQIQERLKHVLASTRVLTEQNLILQKKTFELENLVDIRGVTGVERRDSGRMTGEGEDSVEFDALEFEEYNELHSVAHSFIESIADNRELSTSMRADLLELEGMVIEQGRLSKEFQATIMTTRMVPVSTMVSKLQRNVRQTCRATGKQAELVVEGVDILMDSDVLANLADPLQHVIRNSVDHGLETPEERVMLGKPETGEILLHFYREGNNIVVSCKDDGQGLNFTNIRYTAIQRGLLAEGQEITEAELARMILMSGFSTKSGVTQMSGRGVGMDVVHTNIRQMKGTLDILSETGKGTNMVIKLPMTLVTMHVLIVRVGVFRYGIPTNSLEQVLAHGSGELQRVGNEISLKLGKHIYPIKLLSNLLGVSGDVGEVSLEDQRPLVLVREDTEVICVIVDELIDTHDLVMKSMGQYVKKVRGVSGASILGDGSLVPLLDLPELLRSPTQSMLSSYEGDEEGGTVKAAAGKVPHILIIDDSLSVRKSLSLLVEEAGFECLLAKDGLEAIEVMNQTRPNVILVDMEMPRMNGLEFTSHVRANKATDKLPIFMITSRTTEKHREQAKAAGVSAYVTKPYQDTELLDLIDKGLAGKF